MDKKDEKIIREGLEVLVYCKHQFAELSDEQIKQLEDLQVFLSRMFD